MTFLDQSNQPPPPQQPPGTIDPRPPGSQPAPLEAPRPRYGLQPALFRPYTGNMDADQWGRESWPVLASAYSSGPDSGPYMPSVPEAYSQMASSTSQMARWSAPDVAESAGQVSQLALSFAPLLDIFSKGGFSANFNASSLADIKYRQQEMILKSEEVAQRHQNMMLDFAQIYNAYDTIDPKTKEHGISSDEATRRLLDLSEKYRWDALTQLIAAHGIEAGRQFLKNQHADYLNMISSTSTLKKATGTEEDAETAKEWGLSPPSSGGGAGGITSGVGGFLSGGSSETSAEPDTPSRTRETPASDFDADLSKSLRVSPQIVRAAQEQVATGKPSAGIEALQKKKDNPKKDEALGRTGQLVDELNNRINQISTDPNMSYDDKMKEIARINPDVAGHLKGLFDLELDPKETGVPNRAIMARRAEEIAKSKGSPGPFSQGNYTALRKFEDSPTISREIVRADSMAQAIGNVLKSTKAIDETENNIERKFRAYVAKELTGADDKYTNLFDALADYAYHFYGVESGTGVARMQALKRWLDEIGPNLSPMQIRGAVVQNLSAALQIVNTHQQRYEQIKPGSLMPWISARDYRILRSVVRGNTQTGEMPSDSPREILAVSKDPSKARKGVDTSKPLTMKDIREDYIPRIKKWQNSTDPRQREAVQYARERVGNVIGIERIIPKVDDADEE